MIKRWIFYLTAALGLAIFWAAQQSWLSWCLFSMVLWLPLFSLGVSLVPMLLTRPKFHCSPVLPMGADARVELKINSLFPQPSCRSRLSLSHAFTATTRSVREGDILPTSHCGQITLHCLRFWAYDYLGLFRLPISRPTDCSVLIRPNPLPMGHSEALQRNLAHSWQPKPGGGFAENHELRLYRPGDGLNQIHWKLTAKTGKLMIREAMIPRCGQITLAVHICGTPDQLDRKLGRLLWLGNYLLEQNMIFRIHAATGDGTRNLTVNHRTDLEEAVDQLLCARPMTGNPSDDPSRSALWYFHIGGEPDET